MVKKEAYRHILPHFQQPGQAYFVTWNLKDAVPPKALVRYSQRLETLGAEISNLRKNTGAADSLTQIFDSDSSKIIKRESEFAAPEIASPIEKLKHEYYLVRKKYLKAYDDLLDAARNPCVDLSQPENIEIIIQTLQF